MKNINEIYYDLGKTEPVKDYEVNANGEAILNKGTFYVFGETKVVANDTATVVARDRVRVTARDNSTCVAFDRSTCVANDTATVVAFDRSTVVAFDKSKVVAHDNSRGTAYQHSTVVHVERSTVDTPATHKQMTNEFHINYKGIKGKESHGQI